MSEDTALPSGYRSLEGVKSALRAHGRPFVFGRSVQGRELSATALGSEDPKAPCILVIAGIHALEWIGVETALAVLGRLAETPPNDRTVIVAPVMNPDGYAKVEADLRHNRRRFRRANANGVDLNRNFPSWFRALSLRSLILPRAIDIWWQGREPRSEPEVDALVTMLEERVAAGGTIARTLSLHSFGPKVLHPYGGRWRRPKDGRARMEAERIAKTAGGNYAAVQCARWVPGAFAYGTELDHFHEAFGAISLLVECSKGGIRFTRPSSLFSPFRWFNPPEPAETARDLGDPLDAFLRG